MTNQKKGAATLFHAVRKKWKPAPAGEGAAKPKDESSREPRAGRGDSRPAARGEARIDTRGAAARGDARGSAARGDLRGAARADDRADRAERPAKAGKGARPAEGDAPEGPKKRVLPGAQPLDECLVAYRSLLAKALAHPNTYQQPMEGLTLVKLKNKSLIASLGRPEGGLVLSCKLPKSGPAALAKFSWASPAGRTAEAEGWVVARFARGESVPLRMLMGWIEESHGAVAPVKR